MIGPTMPTLPDAPFGWPVVAYLCLSAVAGVSALFGAAMGHSYEPQAIANARRGLWLALLSSVAGAACLASDLEQPRRFWLVLTEANPTSWISWGARILTLFGLLATFALALQRGRSSGRPGAFHAFVLQLLILVSVALVAYPPFVLQQAQGRPMWQSAWLPPLLVLSGLHLGSSVFGMFAAAPKGRSLTGDPRARAFEVHLVLLGGAALYGFLADVAGAAGAREFARGHDPEVLLAFAVLGLAVPLLFAFTGGGRAVATLRGLAVLAGAVALRAWVVFQGQDTSLSPLLQSLKERF